MNFIRRLNRGKLFSNQSFQILWLIGGIKVYGKIQNFSSISLKLCLLGQKNTGTWGVNITIINLTFST